MSDVSAAGARCAVQHCTETVAGKTSFCSTHDGHLGTLKTDKYQNRNDAQRQDEALESNGQPIKAKSQPSSQSVKMRKSAPSARTIEVSPVTSTSSPAYSKSSSMNRESVRFPAPTQPSGLRHLTYSPPSSPHSQVEHRHKRLKTSLISDGNSFIEHLGEQRLQPSSGLADGQKLLGESQHITKRLHISSRIESHPGRKAIKLGRFPEPTRKMAMPANVQASRPWTTPAASFSLPGQKSNVPPSQHIKPGLPSEHSKTYYRRDDNSRAMTQSRDLDFSAALPRNIYHRELAVSAPDRSSKSTKADSELVHSNDRPPSGQPVSGEKSASVFHRAVGKPTSGMQASASASRDADVSSRELDGSAQSGPARSLSTKAEVATIMKQNQQKLASKDGLCAVKHDHSHDAFDALIYGQGSSLIKGKISDKSVSAPLPSPAHTGLEAMPPIKPIYGHIDPRVHWPQQRSENWREEKGKRIELRGRRKARFGKAAQSLHQAHSDNRPASFEDTLPEKIQNNPDWIRLLKRMAGVPGLDPMPAPKRSRKNKRQASNESPA